MNATPVYKTTPRPYQAQLVESRWDSPGHFLQWEQGVGKTKPLIDVAATLWTQKKIDALLVLAPNGVHFNWVDHELPKHMAVPYKAHAFDNGKDTSGNKAHAAALQYVWEHDPERLSVLTISYHALLKNSLISLVEKGKDRGKIDGRLADFVHERRVMIVGDELVTIKDPKGKMSQRAVALAKRCRYRWGADGTPVDNGPLDLYAQFLFLDSRFWEKHGIGSMTSFTNKFTIQKSLNITLYSTNARGESVVRTRYNPETGRTEPARPQQIVGYKNLNDLHAIIAPYSSRLTKESAGLDLPPKSYIYQPFELTKKQRDVYDRLKKDYMVEVGGHLVDAAMAMTRLIRFQQITCGYLPVDTEGTMVEVDPGHNPRLDVLLSLVDTQTTQGLIWATFRQDRDRIAQALGSKVLCYRSEDTDDAKRDTIARWRAGEAQYLMGHVASGMARGLTLTEGDHAIYYANVFRHAPRKQSEDRIHRIGQVWPCRYYDLSARKTIDQYVVESLVEKDETAAETLGDTLRAWLTT